MIGVLLHEFLNSTCRVNKFLLPCKEGMAGGTNFNTHFSVNRSQLYFVAAGTLCFNFMVFWMNIILHYRFPPKSDLQFDTATFKPAVRIFSFLRRYRTAGTVLSVLSTLKKHPGLWVSSIGRMKEGDYI